MNLNTEIKMCTKCGLEKPIHEFHKKKSGEKKRVSKCKTCKSEIRKLWYQKNREHEISYNAKYVLENKAKKSEWDKAYRQKNLEKIKAYRKEYYHKDREGNIKKTKAFYVQNRESILEKNRKDYAAGGQRRKTIKICQQKYYEKNKEEIKKRVLEYYKKNKDKARTFKAKMRALKSNAEGSHTSQDVKKIIELQRQKCAICKTKIKKIGYHVDHIIPLSKGGGNGINNIQICCPSCNLRKSSKDPIEFMQELGFLL